MRSSAAGLHRTRLTLLAPDQKAANEKTFPRKRPHLLVITLAPLGTTTEQQREIFKLNAAVAAMDYIGFGWPRDIVVALPL